MIFLLVKFLFMMFPVLLAVALLTLLERKVLGFIQFRKGPNLVGPLGLLQPMGDGLKLFMKENLKPSGSFSFLFYFSPFLFFFISLILWSVVMLPESGCKIKLSILFMLSISSFSVCAVLSAGWASKSKYPLLGSMRGVAQMISYEVSLGLVLLPVIIFSGGWSLLSMKELSEKKIWFIFSFSPLFIMWYMSILAETNRSPFDLAEGESELVSGYNVEYSGAPFALFFIGEYAKMILVNVISVILFVGGGSPFSFLKISPVMVSMKSLLLMIGFLWIRGSFPRFRYDQLMMLMWKGFLPLSISLIFVYVMILQLGIFPSFY